MKSKKSFLIGMVAVGLLLVFLITALIIGKNSHTNGDDIALAEIKDVVPEEVKELYKVIEDVNCVGTYRWQIKKGEVKSAVDMSEEDRSNLIFSKLKIDGLLKIETISNESYNTTAKLVFGGNYEPIDEVEAFNTKIKYII